MLIPVATSLLASSVEPQLYGPQLSGSSDYTDSKTYQDNDIHSHFDVH